MHMLYIYILISVPLHVTLDYAEICENIYELFYQRHIPTHEAFSICQRYYTRRLE